jgi:hypothetical protein
VRGGAPSVRRWRHTLRETWRGGAHGLPRRTQHSLTKEAATVAVRGGGTRREGRNGNRTQRKHPELEAATVLCGAGAQDPFLAFSGIYARARARA